MEAADGVLKTDLEERLHVILPRTNRMFHTFSSTFEFKLPVESETDQSDAVGASPAVELFVERLSVGTGVSKMKLTVGGN